MNSTFELHLPGTDILHHYRAMILNPDGSPAAENTFELRSDSVELAAYARRYPLAWRELVRFMGYRLNGSEEDIRALGGMIPMFVFKPVITGKRGKR